MIEPIEFFVPGMPVAQPRAKAGKRGAFVRVYNPDTADEWKSLVLLEAINHVPEWPLWMPLRVDLTFYMPRPQSHFLRGELRESAPVHHACTPDRDNLDKAVLDSLTRLQMWLDDKQVCDGRIRKLYSYYSGLHVRITEAQEIADNAR